MEEASRPLVAWRELAEAVPGAVGVQVGEVFAHVSEELASTLGVEADELVGECWQTLFDESEAARIEADAIERAQTDGQWAGEARFEAAAGLDGPVDVRLSATEGGALVWTVTESIGRNADRESKPIETTDLSDHPGLAATVLNVLDDVIYVIGEDGESMLWNQELAATTGYEHGEIAEMHPKEFIPADQHEYVPGLMEAIESIDDRRVEVDILTRDGERITHEFKGTTFEDPATGEQYRCGLARDVTDRLERERELERQRDDLATLDRINELLLETVRELIQTASRDAVERALCERLASSEFYKFAWVGERAFDGDHIVPRVSAGEGRGYLDAVTITTDRSETGRGPAGEAMRTAEVQVATLTDATFEPWRAAASERGFESVAAVPLHDDGSVYSVLVVYATREDAFSDREQDGFDVLGRTVGSVIHAARNRELLFAEAVAELEFGITDAVADSVFAHVASALDCMLALDGYVASGERWILYVTVTGADPGHVIESATDDDRIERARTIIEEADGGRLELVASASPLLQTVSTAGATVQTATADSDGGTLVVEAPVEADIRDIVDRVGDVYPSATLLAHREHDREITSIGPPSGLLDELTDRQREVLETAYRAGYFDWPRASTAQEVARSLDVAAPTLHGHLRKAEQTLLADLFDGGEPE